MISLRAANLAKILFSLQLPEEKVKEAIATLKDSKELKTALIHPAIKKEEKEAVIDKIFESELRNFIKVLCFEKGIELVDQILEEYESICLASKNQIKGKLSFVIKLEDNEIEELKHMICKKYNKAGAVLELNEDASLIGGFRLMVGNTEYDRSIKGNLKDLEKILARR